MNRREFLHASVALPWLRIPAVPLAGLGGVGVAIAAAPPADRYRMLLVLVELKGGNDGLNTLVPFADPAYYALRPTIAVARDDVVQLSEHAGLHPSLASLAPLWQEGRLAVLQGVGYPEPNLSHFRSIEIWDTASRSEEYLQDGWLTRAFKGAPVPRTFASDGVVVGTNDLGPLAGGDTRALAIADTGQFLRRARLAQPAAAAGNRALAHILKVEADIVQAAAHLDAKVALATEFPRNGFGNAVKTAARIIANPWGVAVVRLTLSGFDTHANQPPTHARLLAELADGLTALRAALVELGKWNDTLVLTYAEFGRRPKENRNSGTDHGTANVQFALGGRVTGGLYGAPPDLARLSADGNPAHALDFRAVYATVLERWWGIDSYDALGGRFAPVPYLTAG
ncbi:MAG: DUF1501 domain-containing protein [Betaproteobacteria bacterium]|nr:DUF1501 domain-containing protein [Betaproteobacteria bacterium]